jgi:hypothetical protein
MAQRDRTLTDRFNQDECCYCLTETPSVMSDALGVPWCKEHQYRGHLITWGMAHAFPALEMAPFAVAHGAYAWYIAATQGSDDYVGMLLGAIEVVYGEVAA